MPAPRWSLPEISRLGGFDHPGMDRAGRRASVTSTLGGVYLVPEWARRLPEGKEIVACDPSLVVETGRRRPPPRPSRTTPPAKKPSGTGWRNARGRRTESASACRRGWPPRTTQPSRGRCSGASEPAAVPGDPRRVVARGRAGLVQGAREVVAHGPGSEVQASGDLPDRVALARLAEGLGLALRER